jgi:hypothetical protein
MAEPSTRRTDARHRKTLGNRFRFAVRALGVFAVLAIAAGAVATAATELPSPENWNADVLQNAASGGHDVFTQVAVCLLTGGAAVVALWAVVEIVSGLVLVTGKRSAIGTNAVVQTSLAVALLVLVNVISFGNYWRFDTTRDREFTLAKEQVDELRKLRPDAATTIVVLQKHKTAGTLSDTPDAYDYAAERKVVEKVRDLVDQVREFGPRFNVVVLDAADDRYERTVKALTRTRPGLQDAIDKAPENSIFFYADGKVQKRTKADAEKLLQGSAKPAVAPDPDDAGSTLVYQSPIGRMSFAEFYQLDKTASREATPAEREGLSAVGGGAAFAQGIVGKGNLVLIPRGKEAFVSRILSLEERRPKVGLAVIHPILTSREATTETYSAAGLRKALELNGFDVTDIILKKGWEEERGGLTPDAYTYEESELERVEARYTSLTEDLEGQEIALKQYEKYRPLAEKDPLDEVNRKFRLSNGKPVLTEADRQDVLTAIDRTIEELRRLVAATSKSLAEVGPKYRSLLGDERSVENRRIADVKLKMNQYLDECDVLVVPRLTTVDLAAQHVYPPSLFHLSQEQAAVVREFVKAGKPVLFGIGPAVPRGPRLDAMADDVDRLLPRLGIELGRQTIVTDREFEAMADRRGGLSSSVDLPPLSVVPPEPPAKPKNPIAAAFEVTTRAVDKTLEVKRGGYRPVYLAPGFAERLPFAPEILYTTKDAWNEDRPLPERDYRPKYEPSKPDDGRKGTRNEERRGPFPVGVAVEVPVPVEWFDANPEIAPKAVPGAAAVGVAGAYPLAPQFAEHEQLAGLMLFADGGISAGLLHVVATKTDRPTVRVVAFGHGGLFTGTDLKPGHQTLLLHTMNWLLRRPERLPADVPDEQKWRFPRATLTEREAKVWKLGTITMLPMLCGLAGVVVLMARKVR